MARQKDYSKEIKRYTIKEILSYMDCSLCHHLEYVMKLQPPQENDIPNKNEIFKDAIYKSIGFYYMRHMNKKPANLKEVLDKFVLNWNEGNKRDTTLSTLTRDFKESMKQPREVESRYISKGLEMIRGFFEYNNKKKQSILSYNHNYEIPVKNAIIEGIIPLIREVQLHKERRAIDLVHFATSKKTLDYNETKINFSYLLNAFAFNRILKIVPDRIIVYNLSRNEETILRYSENDYKRLFNIIEAFLESIDNVRPYPTIGAHSYTTKYKSICAHYNYKKNPIE